MRRPPLIEINPIAFHIGPFAFSWYGILYASSLLYLFMQMKRALRSDPKSRQYSETLRLTTAFFMLFGAKLSSLLLYRPLDIWKHPIHWVTCFLRPGLTFYGALLGGTLGLLACCRYYHLPFFQLSDTIVLHLPVALGLGRVANFINGELYGRPCTSFWAMGFPKAGDHGTLGRHPSQLYEAILEGIGLWSYLHGPYAKKPNVPGTKTCQFLLGYTLLRIIGESFRQEPYIIVVRGVGITLWQTVSSLLFLFTLCLKPIVLRKDSPRGNPCTNTYI